MSRSIHKTAKGVFYNKSVAEIDKMIEENDPDVEELRKKYSYRNEERDKRKLSKQAKNLNQK